MKKILNNHLTRLLLLGETSLLRFWLALCSFGYSFWVFFDESYSALHPVAISLVTAPTQTILFFVHGASVMYGVYTNKYNTGLLITEGLLGVFLWFGIGVAESYQQGTPGPMLIAGFISLFLLIRYPTHYDISTGILSKNHTKPDDSVYFIGPPSDSAEVNDVT